jgi:hypothetical protein
MAFPSVVAAVSAFGSLLLQAVMIASRTANADKIFFILILFVFAFKLVFESFISFYAQNG